MDGKEFFAEATESQRYKLIEVIGKGSYGVVASAVDQFTGARAAGSRAGPQRSCSDAAGGQPAGATTRRRGVTSCALRVRWCRRRESRHQEDHKRV
jgi:hypothetical protein